MDKDLTVVIYAISGFLAAKLVDLVFSYGKDQKKETIENTLAIKELTVEIKYMREAVVKLPKLESDMNHAFVKLRELEKSFNG